MCVHLFFSPLCLLDRSTNSDETWYGCYWRPPQDCISYFHTISYKNVKNTQTSDIGVPHITVLIGSMAIDPLHVLEI
jgi:hypothetical protein